MRAHVDLHLPKSFGMDVRVTAVRASASHTNLGLGSEDENSERESGEPSMFVMASQPHFFPTTLSPADAASAEGGDGSDQTSRPVNIT